MRAVAPGNPVFSGFEPGSDRMSLKRGRLK
jgi:hypothetical protein